MTSAAADRLTIGYLQVGPREHGICRYGRLLATEGRRREDLAIIEENIILTGDHSADQLRLQTVAEHLSGADLVHLQVSVSDDTTWGRNGRSLGNLRIFRRHCRTPLIITLHDVNTFRSIGCASAGPWLQRAAREVLKVPLRPAVRLFRQVRRGQLHLVEAFTSLTDFVALYPYLITRWVGRSATALLVVSGEEKTALDAIQVAGHVALIPHFIEDRPVLPRPADSPSLSTKTVIMAGFIFKNKGYDLMLEAMSLLPEIELVLVGGPRLGVSGSDTASRLMDRAQEKGVAHRVQVTGYLSEEDYQRYLDSADLAVCPFEHDKSASGSLSSLIAAGCPILASDIPLIGEYNVIAPGAIATFSPYTAVALASAIRVSLGKSRDQNTRGLAELRHRLSIATIYDQHLEIYQRARATR